MTERIVLEIEGRIAGSGSKNAYPFKDKDTGKLSVRVAPASKYQLTWQERIYWTFRNSKYYKMIPWECAIKIICVFRKVRSPSHYNKKGELNAAGLRQPHPSHRIEPDLTKAVRAIEDALNGLVFKDDKQVVEQHNYFKWGDNPGAKIIIEKLDN